MRDYGRRTPFTKSSFKNTVKSFRDDLYEEAVMNYISKNINFELSEDDKKYLDELISKLNKR